MGPRIIQHDNADREPQGSKASSGDHSWSRPQPRAFDWRGIGVLCGFLLMLLLIGYWLFGRDIRFWIQYGGGGWVPNAAILVALAFLIKKFLLVEQPGGYKVLWFRADERKVIEGMLRVQQAEAARMFAEARQLTLTGAQPAMPQIETEDYVDGEILPPALLPTPDQEWLNWIDRTPHLMIAGRTEAGKTTMAEAVIAQRAMAGELLYVLDPHYQPGKWCGLPATGGGRGYGDVMNALGFVIDEMDTRYKDFNQGKRTEDFDRLTVFIDEVPALVEWCFDGKKLRDQRWMSFAKQLGSEARKVRISVILMTQSPLVQDIQINTRMRENFTRIALGDQSIELIKEAREPRRTDLEKLIEGQRYTAAMEYQNQVHVLDTSNVQSLARRHVAHLARPWGPTQIAPARPVVSASVRPSATVSASFSPADLLSVPTPDGRTPDGQRTRLYLKAMAGAGKTREEARARMSALNMPFENSMWTEVRRELGLKS